jgi:hypothetical protein
MIRSYINMTLGIAATNAMYFAIILNEIIPTLLHTPLLLCDVSGPLAEQLDSGQISVPEPVLGHGKRWVKPNTRYRRDRVLHDGED